MEPEFEIVQNCRQISYGCLYSLDTLIRLMALGLGALTWVS